MKQVVRIILAAAAVAALAVPAMGASTPKLKVMDPTGTIVKFVVNDDGTIGASADNSLYPFYMTSDNAGAVPAGVGSFMMFDSSNKGRFEVRSFGNVYSQGPVFQGKGGGGTATAPTATLLDHNLFMLGGSGHDGTGIVGANTALIKIKAESNWSTTSRGTVVTFETTPTGSITRSEYFRVNGNGVQVTNGGLVFAATAAAPTCSATIRGMMYYTQGAVGVKDTLQVCAKDATEAYAWRTIY